MPKIVVETGDLYSAQETASLLGVGIATVWRWVRAKKLSVVKVGGRTLIPKSEIKRLKKIKRG